MSTSTRKGPTRHRVELPTSGRWPRVGKIRLGTLDVNEEKSAELGFRVGTPKKADHFIVTADDGGITSPEAAAAFAEVYPGQPRELRVMLAGETPDDCVEGAWRLYGKNKLKRRCDGELCAERTPTGGWRDTPCVCKANGIAPRSDDHCKLTYTLNVILPDVAVPGVWQIDTGGEISAHNVADFLQMIAEMRRGESIRFMEADLFLVPVSVQPEGMTKSVTVYVLKPQPRGATTRQLLSGAGFELGPSGPAELPRPAADDVPEPTLDPGSHVAPALSPSSDGEPDPDPTAGDAQPAGQGRVPIAEQIGELDKADRARLKARALTWTVEKDGEMFQVRQTVQRLAAYIEERWPGEDLPALLDQLDISDPLEPGEGEL